jgi:hypothetical protein
MGEKLLRMLNRNITGIPVAVYFTLSWCRMRLIKMIMEHCRVVEGLAWSASGSWTIGSGSIEVETMIGFEVTQRIRSD